MARILIRTFFRCERFRYPPITLSELPEAPIRIFPNEASCLRLVRAVAVEQHEEWLEGARYLDMDPLREQRKAKLALAA